MIRDETGLILRLKGWQAAINLGPKETKKDREKERMKERRKKEIGKKIIQRQRTCVTCQREIMDKIQ